MRQNNVGYKLELKQKSKLCWGFSMEIDSHYCHHPGLRSVLLARSRASLFVTMLIFIFISSAGYAATVTGTWNEAIAPDNDSRCKLINNDPKNSCAYPLEQNSAWSGSNTVAGKIITEMHASTDLSSSKLTTVISNYSSQYCSDRAVQACVIPKLLFTCWWKIDSSNSDPHGGQSAHATFNIFDEAKGNKKQDDFIKDFLNAYKSNSSSVDGKVTASESKNQSMASQYSSAFKSALSSGFAPTLEYCPNLQDRSTQIKQALATLTGASAKPNIPNLVKGKGEFDGLLSMVLGGTINQTCTHVGNIEFDDNTATIATTSGNNSIFATINSCVGSDSVEKIEITASSNSENNTAAGNTGNPKYCAKEFDRLSADRALSMLDRLKIGLNLTCEAPITAYKALASGKQFYFIKNNPLKCTKAGKQIKVSFSTGGLNGDGTSGPCAYKCTVNAQGDCTESKRTGLDSLLQAAKYARVSVTKSMGSAGVAEKYHIKAARNCYGLILGCATSPPNCGSTGKLFTD